MNVRLFGPPLLSAGLFFGMLACLYLGFRAGRRTGAGNEEPDGFQSIDAAIFALLGLLLGFAFAGATSRLDARRQLIVHEANAIGTAYLRLDLAPVAAQPGLRHLFRKYLEARVQAYERPEISIHDFDRAAQLQRRIWEDVIVASRTDQTQNVARVLVPAVNEMIDVTTARTVALGTRVPVPILFVLILLALFSAVVAGRAMARRQRPSALHAVLYAAAVATTVYVVLDLDNPRVGLIRLEATERVLHELHDAIRE